MKLRTVLSAALCMTLAAAAYGQDKLGVGDTAPGLDIETWVKGDETKIQEGNVYVVEFWATWCAPCKRSIPHLTKLQEQYADEGLTIIGVSADDKDTETVEKFVRSQGGKMAYTVAVDRRQGTKRAWFDAAKQNGIPCAFVVDRRGKVAWIGNPLDEEFDATLKGVMTGRFDPKLSKKAQPILEAARTARKLQNWRSASKYYDEVINLDPGIFAAVALEKFDMLLLDMDDRTQAYEFARSGLMDQQFASDVGALQMLSEKIAHDPKIDESKRDLDAALEVAQASRRLAGQNDPTALAAVASVHFKRGEVDQAISLQKQAYFNAVPKKKPEFKRILTMYQGASTRSDAMSSRK